MTINIEITTTPDICALAAIHTACFEKAWHANAINEMLMIRSTVAVVAFLDRAIQGFGLLRCVDDAEILTLAVMPDCRKRGIGKAITTAMCEWAGRQGAKTVFLEVREGNAEAQALYLKAGFSRISKRKGYYNNDNGMTENAIIMRRVITRNR